jgi:hypothetical protein
MGAVDSAAGLGVAVQCLHQVARGFSSSLIANTLQHSVQPLQLRPWTILTTPFSCCLSMLLMRQGMPLQPRRSREHGRRFQKVIAAFGQGFAC